MTSPPPIHAYNLYDNHGPTSSISLARVPNRSISRTMPRGQRPIAVPNSMPDMVVPPPLPPPRYIDDLAAGSDPGYQWANHLAASGDGKARGTVAATSSLRGNWGRRTEPEGERKTQPRRAMGTDTGRHAPEVGARTSETPKHQDEGYSSLSGSSFLNQQSVQLFLRDGSCIMAKIIIQAKILVQYFSKVPSAWNAVFSHSRFHNPPRTVVTDAAIILGFTVNKIYSMRILSSLHARTITRCSRKSVAQRLLQGAPQSGAWRHRPP